ncbi:MAG TPA: MarR family winged helix-turn-helix transcriptional regulator [Spirochaetia bacterium]
MSETRKLASLLSEWVEACTLRSIDGMRGYLKGLSLSMPQFGLLMRLYHRGSCDVSEIGRGFGVTSAAASQLVDKLVLAGLVVRTEGAVDRRRRTVGLTERGRDLIAKGFEMWSDWVPELLESLGAEGRRKASELLPSLVAAEKSLPRRSSISVDARCNKRGAVSS